MSIQELKPDTSKSSSGIIRILRDMLKRAFSEKITYLEINMTIDGKKESISISTHEMNRPVDIPENITNTPPKTKY